MQWMSRTFHFLKSTLSCLYGGCLNGQGQISPRLQNIAIWGKLFSSNVSVGLHAQYLQQRYEISSWSKIRVNPILLVILQLYAKFMFRQTYKYCTVSSSLYKNNVLSDRLISAATVRTAGVVWQRVSSHRSIHDSGESESPLERFDLHLSELQRVKALFPAMPHYTCLLYTSPSPRD